LFILQKWEVARTAGANGHNLSGDAAIEGLGHKGKKGIAFITHSQQCGQYTKMVRAMATSKVSAVLANQCPMPGQCKFECNVIVEVDRSQH